MTLEMMIFFDIDGTLLDHQQADQEAVHSFFEIHAADLDRPLDEFVNGWQIASANQYQRYLRGDLSFQEQRRERLREVFLPSQALTDQEADRLFDDYLQLYEENWALFPEVQSVLKDLSSFSLGIISNGDSQQQRRKLELTGIVGSFSVILISGDIGVAKPSPNIFLHACRQAGLLPNQCCHVGDHVQEDALAAHKTGLLGIWINRQAKKLTTSIPKVASLSEVRPLVELMKKEKY